MPTARWSSSAATDTASAPEPSTIVNVGLDSIAVEAQFGRRVFIPLELQSLRGYSTLRVVTR